MASLESVTLHLLSEQPLFKRAIVMSGTYFLLRPLERNVQEESYNAAIAALGLEDKTPKERIKALLETPAQELISKLPPSIPFIPAVDEDLIPHTLTFSQTGDRDSKLLRGKNWCKDLMIGDAQVDVSIDLDPISNLLLMNHFIERQVLQPLSIVISRMGSQRNSFQLYAVLFRPTQRKQRRSFRNMV